jgi:TolA-binding protein
LINFDLELKNVQPINIKDMQLSRSQISNNIIKSIILYNKAIAEIKTNDINLAIKDLKKALSFNQGFAEAIKLLGLCYVNNDEYRKAKKAFKNMIKNEMYKDLANEYLRNLVTKTSTPRNNNQLRKKIIIGFSVSVIITAGFIITYHIVSNSNYASKKSEADNKSIAYEKSTDKNSEQAKILVEENAKLHKDYKNIETELNNTKSQLNYYKNKYDVLSMLNEAEILYKNGNYEKAASNLIRMKNMKLDGELKTRFDKLWSEVKSKGLWTIYNDGNKLYKQGKYKEALPKLIITSELDSSLNIMPWITYQIAKCYKATNDNTNALVFFKKVKNNYPNSEYASYSEGMIKEIESKKN